MRLPPLNARWVRDLNLVRSGLYFLESIPLTLVSRFITHPELPPPTREQLQSLWTNVLKIHTRDSEAVATGLYPLTALEIENPLKHLRSFIDVLSDGVRVATRMKNRDSKSFDKKAHALKADLPEYYTRNFHFQTDGYLSQASARRYDHQVDILFSGTTGAMRRQILPVLKKQAKTKGPWLEIGCGSGSTTRPVLETFPKAKITALDLSSPYLKVAQQDLAKFDNVDFVQGNATDLTFKDETFAAVYSTYLFHELPPKERRQVAAEAYRVLKPGGVLIFADSLQWDNDPDLNWALERFPKVYHEPFYPNYLRDDLGQLFKEVTGQEVHEDQAFLTKMVWLKKSDHA